MNSKDLPKTEPPLRRRPKSQPRWMWATGASAAGMGAAATGALAGTVQITHNDNHYSMINGIITDSLKKDLTRDGIDEFPNLMGTKSSRSGPWSSMYTISSAPYTYAGPGRYYRAIQVFSQKIGEAFETFLGSARFGSGTQTIPNTASWTWYSASVAGIPGAPVTYMSNSMTYTFVPFRVGTYSTVPVPSIKALRPITFQDAAINSGNPTDGFVEIEAAATTRNTLAVRLLRLIFDDASTAEPMNVSPGDPAFSEFQRPGGGNAGDNGAAAAAAAQKAALQSDLSRTIKKEKGKLKKAKKSGNAKKAKKIKAKIKKLKKQLASL